MTPEVTQSIAFALNAANAAEAERLCRTQLLAHPEDADGLLLLAISLQIQHRMPEAITVYRHLTELFPSSSLHWCNYANALRGSGAREEAESAYTTSVRLDPRNAGPKIGLGLMLIERKEYASAREVLLDACELDMTQPLARIHAARACFLCEDARGVSDLLKPWPNWVPLDDDSLQLELAKLLHLIGDADVVPLLKDLLQRRPDDHEPKLLLAAIYERVNRLADAEAIITSVDRARETSFSHETASELDHVKAQLALRRGDPAEARALLEQCGPRHDVDFAHYFELAKTCDKLRDASATTQALLTAHALQVKEIRLVSPEYFEPDTPDMPGNMTSVTADSLSRWPKLSAPVMRDSPIFIVGFPRSGTTLLEQMLDAHPGLQSMDENPFFNRLAFKLRQHDPRILQGLHTLQQYDCDELRKSYQVMVSETIMRRQGTRLVDKNPLNMRWLPLIHRLFPDARIILALRHPCDVILSCYMQNFRSSILAAACATLERLAKAYVQVMEHWLEDERLLRPQVLASRYEELVADFPSHASRIAQFLELEDATPMLTFDKRALEKGYIATPSYTQVIEPINTKAVNRWFRYRREFEPVLPILEPMLKHWGYAVETGG